MTRDNDDAMTSLVVVKQQRAKATYHALTLSSIVISTQGITLTQPPSKIFNSSNLDKKWPIRSAIGMRSSLGNGEHRKASQLNAINEKLPSDSTGAAPPLPTPLPK